jgi:hypothetical protein
MIFENRIATPPSSAVVAFRDELEEATAAARANRSDAPAPTPATVQAAAPAAPATTTAPVVAPAPAPASGNQTFQPVQDTPAQTETLPPSTP